MKVLPFQQIPKLHSQPIHTVRSGDKEKTIQRIQTAAEMNGTSQEETQKAIARAKYETGQTKTQ